MTLLFLLVVLSLLAIFEAPMLFFSLSIALFMIVFGYTSILLWGMFILVNVVSFHKSTRENLLTGPLMRLISKFKLLPSISKTEKTALMAGTTWIEADFFKGYVDFSKIYTQEDRLLSDEEKAFLETQAQEVCAMTSDWEIFQKRDLPKKVWDYLKKEKFLGMIIPKEYGGLGFSALGHSVVIEKLVSRSQVLAISVMVPNSLGPAELIMHYGTQHQKEYFLPRLAVGKEVPCFALTEPNAGSDATSITSKGDVFRDEDGTLRIRLNFDKRYITLSQIATLIGVAFHLEDKENLLGFGEQPGITFALVDAKKEGIDQSQKHDPLGVPFINAPIIGKDVIIDIDDIIGGQEGIGQGWKMLTASLAVGRGISLPSTATGATKLAAMVTGSYVGVREQFGLPIGKFEGIQEMVGTIGGLAYLQNASKKFVLDALDSGIKPAVVNSVMKYHATENARTALNHAMDVVGGAGIIQGPKNLLATLYKGIPVSITVEGANILTRNLMQFGQGLIRCHPYIYNEFEALEKNDLHGFDEAFSSHVGLGIKNTFKAFGLYASRGLIAPSYSKGKMRRTEQRFGWAAAWFALLSEVALGLLGGGLKRQENISARFADMLSWLYLGSAALRHYKHHKNQENELLTMWATETALGKIQKAMEDILRHLGGSTPLNVIFMPFLWLVRINPIGLGANDALQRSIATKMMEEPDFLESLSAGIYLPKEASEPLAGLRLAALHVRTTASTRHILKEAHKKGRISRVDALDEALIQGLITQEEATRVRESFELIAEAIRVDAFEPKVYNTLR